jgi:hypothetical protein
MEIKRQEQPGAWKRRFGVEPEKDGPVPEKADSLRFRDSFK